MLKEFSILINNELINLCLCNYQLDFFHQGLIREFFKYRGTFLKKWFNLFFWLKFCKLKNVKELLIVSTFSDTRTHSSPKPMTWILASRSLFKTFRFRCTTRFLRKLVLSFFRLCSGILVDKKKQKVLEVFFSLDMLAQISSILLASLFNQGVTQKFFTSSGLSVFNHPEVCSVHRT